MRPTIVVSIALAASLGAASAVSIDAVYFAQTHVQKPDHPYFGLVSERQALIKAHVADPAMPAAPAVTAVLTLGGDTLNLPLNGPATLPASIPDGPGVVQHSFADSFTATIPASWVKPGLEVNVTAGPASVKFTDLKIGAPTKVVMTMFDVQYFNDTNGDYPAGTFEELKAKWPVAELEIRRIPHVVFPELVIPPRAGVPAARVGSPADYQAQTGLGFDGEQAAALAWNGALKRAAGRSGRISLYYTNIYGVNAGGQAGGFAGVGNGTSHGIFHHELGHALSLPHWGDSGIYPYKGTMHGIDPPAIYNETHAGPTWAYDLRLQTFIPPTVQPGNVGSRPVGTYKADPMQGGGTGFQEPGYLMNHFSDFSVFRMRNYLHGHVLVWNEELGSYAAWNQSTAGYTSTVSNNGVQYPVERDVQVISVMASISGSNPDVNMVYPPIGPFSGGLIRLFDPRNATDRADAAAIFAPAGGCDVSLRIIQGGVEKIHMLAAPWEPGVDPLSGGSLKTEAVNLPASDGTVIRVELLLTPDAQVNGLPEDPEVLYTWSVITPDPAGFAVVPTAAGSSSISMTAVTGTSAEGTAEYLFTETSGNPGGSSSGWQSSPFYTDAGLQPSTEYSYTVTMRAGTYTGSASAPASAITSAPGIPGNITFDGFVSGYIGGTPKTFTFDASGSDKLVVIVTGEHNFDGNTTGNVITVTYDGVSLTKAVEQNPVSSTLQTTSDLWYLDNPGSVHIAGVIVISVEGSGNNYVHAALALSGTAPGFAGASAIAIGTPAADINVSAPNSMLISWLTLGGNGNTAGTATSIQANSPAEAIAFGGTVTGGNYAGHVLARTSGLAPGMHTFSFDTALTDVLCLAAEFLAAEIPATDYQIWSLLYPADDLTDPNADFDGDGLDNDEERIWGLDPTSGTAVSPVETTPSPASGTLTYTRRKPALTGRGFRCEWSSSLKPDEWFPFTPADEAIQTTGDVETVEVTLPRELLGESKLFIRVVAEP